MQNKAAHLHLASGSAAAAMYYYYCCYYYYYYELRVEPVYDQSTINNTPACVACRPVQCRAAAQASSGAAATAAEAAAVGEARARSSHRVGDGEREAEAEADATDARGPRSSPTSHASLQCASRAPAAR